MVGKSDEGEMTGVIERDSERGEGVTGGSQDERRSNPTKGTRPPPTTDREGFREGRGCDWGESGWTGEKNRVVVGMNP